MDEGEGPATRIPSDVFSMDAEKDSDHARVHRDRDRDASVLRACVDEIDLRSREWLLDLGELVMQNESESE